MKIVIVGGAGAMGGVWASRLQAAGHDVAILDVSAEAIAVINRDGLTVEQKDGSTTVSSPGHKPGARRSWNFRQYDGRGKLGA